MPIYEFKCRACDSKFETLRTLRDEKPAVCPTCGGEETMRLLSLFAAPAKDSGAGSLEAAPAWGGGGGCCGGSCGCARN